MLNQLHQQLYDNAQVLGTLRALCDDAVLHIQLPQRCQNKHHTTAVTTVALIVVLTSSSLQPQQAVIWVLHSINHVVTRQIQNIKGRLQQQGAQQSECSTCSCCRVMASEYSSWHADS